VSRTAIAGLDLVLSNDDRGELNTLLLHAPDGRLRLRHLLPVFRTHYDLLLIDTQGARSVLLEMAVLASDLALSPVTPEILAARELRRGTLQLIEDIAPYRHLGIEPPPLRLLINRVHPVSSNARMVQQALRQVQPTLSSYYDLAHRAPGGIYELLAFNERGLDQLVSRTIIAGLDLVLAAARARRAPAVAPPAAGAGAAL